MASLEKVATPEDIGEYVKQVYEKLNLGGNLTFGGQLEVKKELAIALMSNPSVSPYLDGDLR
jgi:hypothetical protein